MSRPHQHTIRTNAACPASHLGQKARWIRRPGNPCIALGLMAGAMLVVSGCDHHEHGPRMRAHYAQPLVIEQPPPQPVIIEHSPPPQRVLIAPAPPRPYRRVIVEHRPPPQPVIIDHPSRPLIVERDPKSPLIITKPPDRKVTRNRDARPRTARTPGEERARNRE